MLDFDNSLIDIFAKYCRIKLICIIVMLGLFSCSSNIIVEHKNSNNSNKEIGEKNIKNNLAINKTKAKTKFKLKVPSASINDIIKLLSDAEHLNKMPQLLKKIENENMNDFYSNILYSHALNYSIREMHKKSAEYFYYLLKLEKNKFKYIYLSKKYAIELIRSGDIDISLPILEKLVFKFKIQNLDIRLLLGGVYTALNKTIKSRKVYRELWDRYKLTDACIFLANSYFKIKANKKALNIVNKCNKEKPQAQFMYLLGNFFVENKNFKTAKKYYFKALKLNKRFDRAAIAIGKILEKRNASQAINYYKKYLKLNNINSRQVTSLLVQLMLVNEFKESIIPYMEKLINFEPDNLNLKLKLGIMYSEIRKFSKAKDLFSEILMSKPNSYKVIYYLAAINEATKNFEEAIKYYNQIPSDSELYFDSSMQIAKILKQLVFEDFLNSKQQNFMSYKKNSSSYKKAETFYKNIIADTSLNNKQKIEISMIFVSLYEAVNDIKSAIVTLEYFDGKNLENDHLLVLSALYDKNKDYKKLDTLLLKMLKREPQNPQILNFLGYSYLERGIHLDLSYKYLTHANKILPNNAYILDSLGWFHFKRGNIKKGLKLVLQAFKHERNDIDISRHLAYIFFEMKEFKRAKKYSYQVLKQCVTIKDRQTILKFISKISARRSPASKTEKP